MSIAKMIDHTMLKADTKEETILRYCKEAKEYEMNSGVIDEERKKLSTKWSGKGGAYIVGIFLFFMFAPLIVILFPILIEFIICAVLCFKNAGKISA